MKILTDTFLRMMDRRHIEDTFVDGLEIVDRGEGDDFDGEGYFQCDSVVFKCGGMFFKTPWYDEKTFQEGKKRVDCVRVWPAKKVIDVWTENQEDEGTVLEDV